MTTDFLFARASFWRGFGRILDLGGTWFEFNKAESVEQADAIATQMDWEVVAKDFKSAISEYQSKTEGVQGHLPL